jgi:plastocyanin
MSEVQTATTEAPRGTKLATFGFIMVALGPILFIIAALLWDLNTDDIVFLIVTAAIALVGAFVVRIPAAWSKVLGIVLAILSAGALFWTAFGLLTPGSFFDFVPGLLVIPGGIIAIVGCVSALRARSAAEPRSSEGHAKAMRIIATAVFSLALVSGVLTFLGKSEVNASDSEGRTVIVLKDFEYGETEYQLAPGDEVVVRNEDPFLHTFTVDDLGIDVSLTPGSEELIRIPEDSGSYIVYCRPHTSDPDKPTADDMYSKLEIH